MVVVLYMSMRIRSEQLTVQMLSAELSSMVPITSAIEMGNADNEPSPAPIAEKEPYPTRNFPKPGLVSS